MITKNKLMEIVFYPYGTQNVAKTQDTRHKTITYKS